MTDRDDDFLGRVERFGWRLIPWVLGITAVIVLVRWVVNR